MECMTSTTAIWLGHGECQTVVGYVLNLSYDIRSFLVIIYSFSSSATRTGWNWTNLFSTRVKIYPRGHSQSRYTSLSSEWPTARKKESCLFFSCEVHKLSFYLPNEQTDGIMCPFTSPGISWMISAISKTA